jgi:retinol dehydrogenase 12
MKELLVKGAKVYIACRDDPKARAAIDDIEKETGYRASSLTLDLADLASVEECAKEFLR